MYDVCRFSSHFTDTFMTPASFIRMHAHHTLKDVCSSSSPLQYDTIHSIFIFFYSQFFNWTFLLDDWKMMDISSILRPVYTSEFGSWNLVFQFYGELLPSPNLKSRALFKIHSGFKSRDPNSEV